MLRRPAHQAVTKKQHLTRCSRLGGLTLRASGTGQPASQPHGAGHMGLL
jgi:hypothetical protein